MINTKRKKEQDQADTKESASYWLKWKTEAIKAADTHWKDSAEAYKEYLHLRPKVETASTQAAPEPSRFPIFWASIKNLLPAYYSRSPICVSKRMFDNQDNTARVASLMQERMAKYLMECKPIDAAMIQACLDFLLADKGTVKFYCEELKEVKTRTNKVYQNNEEYLDETGQVIKPGMVQEGAEGLEYSEEYEELAEAHFELLPICYDDIIHTPYARDWSEVKEIGFRLWLDRQEFVEYFGEDKLDLVTFGARKTEDGKAEGAAVEGTDDKILQAVEVWEIWDKKDKKVRYVTDKCKSQVLNSIDDPYGLPGFFPCPPFAIGTKPAKNLYPTPMYVQLKSTIEQLHGAYTRLRRAINALRRRGIADASLTDVATAINEASENEVVIAKEFQQIVDKGGVAQALQWLPLDELAKAVAELKDTLKTFQELFYQFSGVPDIVRGMTDAGETASAQQMKGQFFSVRASWDMWQIQALAKGGIEMMVDAAFNKLPEPIIMEYTGVEFFADEDKQFVAGAIALLKDNKSRKVRLEIETDSMSYLSDMMNQQKRQQVAETILTGLEKTAAMAQTNQAFIKPTLDLLLFVLRGMDLGKSFEEEIRMVGDEFTQAALAPSEEPVPPDYEQMKIEIANNKLMLEGQKQQGDMFIKQRELDVKEQKLMQDDMLSQVKTQLEAQLVSIQQQAQDLDVRAQSFREFAEQQRLELESWATSLAEREKMIEENRLAIQANQDAFEQSQPEEPAEPVVPAPTTVIINNPAQPEEPTIVPFIPTL